MDQLGLVLYNLHFLATLLYIIEIYVYVYIYIGKSEFKAYVRREYRIQ